MAFAKLYDRATSITAVNFLNDRVMPFFEQHHISLRRVVTDGGTEYYGDPAHHDYELYLASKDIDHPPTETTSPQTRGICERFYRAAIEEFYHVAFHEEIYTSIASLQVGLDKWVATYNALRPHQERWCYGRTPMQTWLDACRLVRQK